jgi:hypothetical protein
MRKLRRILTIAMMTIYMYRFTSCLVTARKDNGKHRGWFHRYDDGHHHDRRVYVIENQKQPKYPKGKKIKVKHSKDKNRWDAKK